MIHEAIDSLHAVILRTALANVLGESREASAPQNTYHLHAPVITLICEILLQKRDLEEI